MPLAGEGGQNKQEKHSGGLSLKVKCKLKLIVEFSSCFAAPGRARRTPCTRRVAIFPSASISSQDKHQRGHHLPQHPRQRRVIFISFNDVLHSLTLLQPPQAPSICPFTQTCYPFIFPHPLTLAGIQHDQMAQIRRMSHGEEFNICFIPLLLTSSHTIIRSTTTTGALYHQREALAAARCGPNTLPAAPTTPCS